MSVFQLTKKILKQTLAFVCDQYMVLFFMFAVDIKLYYFSTYITKMAWSTHYGESMICSYLFAAIIFLPLLFIRRHKNKLAFILAFVISFLLVVDSVYYSYYSSLPTIGLLGILGQTTDVGPAIVDLLRWGYLLFFIDFVLALALVKPSKKFTQWLKKRYVLEKPRTRFSWTIVVVVLIAFWYSLLPVGLTNLRDVLDKGYDTVSTSQYYGILMAHAIDTVRIIEQETTRLSSSQEKDLIAWAKDNRTSRTSDALTGTAKGKNVIMVQIESLGGFVINQKINGKEITPNLNQLSKTTQFFPNERFMIGAGHTSDTDFVANSSYFPLPDAATFVRYGQDDFTSLPKNLISNGYSAYAFHGFNRNFWNRNIALKSLGYQKFYAADNYPKGVKLNMGLNDGDFLSKTAEYIKGQPKPSLSYVITLSSHVPFATNDQTRELGVKISDYPDQVGGYFEDINYTDRMLGKFFDKLKSEKLYDNSLILIYGDHEPVLPAFSAGTIKYDPSSVQGKEVPLLVKLPNETVGKTYNNQGAHIDIMPTVLDLLGIKTSQLMFGQSLFASGDKALKVCQDQLVAFPGSDDCKTRLTNEENKSATIIRYNQFDNINKR